MTNTIAKDVKNIDFMDLMGRLLGLLTDKEKNILERRFSLGEYKRETLDRIGKSYNITRERVRQIESVALRKLARISMDPNMRLVHDLAYVILTENGGVMVEKKLLTSMIERLESKNELDENSIKLALKVAQNITRHERSSFARPFWRTKELTFTTIRVLADDIHSFMQADPTSIYTEVEISKEVRDERYNPSLSLIRSVLELDKRFLNTPEGWGLSNCRLINPKSIKDRIMVILTDYSKPMHFRDIIDAVHKNFTEKKNVTDQAVHNELIRHAEFVLVGRGMYGLSNWGMASGTVCDIIIEVMREHGEPMKRQLIIQKVLEKRDIRVGTISLNLQKYDFFERVGRAVYIYNDAKDVRRRRQKLERVGS